LQKSKTKTQAKKELLLAQLLEARASILSEASALSVGQRNTVFLDIWSVRELLAHLAGWDYTNIEAIQSVLAGNLPSFYKYHDRDWQTYNSMLVEKYRQGSFRKLLSTVRTSHKKLVEFLQTIPPEHFNRDFGVRFRGYKVTVQRLVEADIKDVTVHCQQIKEFFKE
jgi:hypothetical protein